MISRRCKSALNPTESHIADGFRCRTSHPSAKNSDRLPTKSAAGPRGEVRGPVRVWLYSPELAARAQKLGEFLRWNTVPAPRISELVVLVTARHYDCDYIWFNHAPLAQKHGISPQAIDCIKTRRAAVLEAADEAAAYAFTSEMLGNNAASDAML